MNAKQEIKIKLLVKELRELLKEDILERYNHSEYWDIDIIKYFMVDYKVSKEEEKEIRKMLR